MPTTKDALIAKYVSGNCLPEEEKLLLDWCGKDKHLAKQLELAQKAWNDAGHIRKTASYSTDAAWEEFVRLKNEAPKSIGRNQTRAFFLRTAAVFVALLAIGFVIRIALFEKATPLAEHKAPIPVSSLISDIQVISVYSADSALTFPLPDSSRVSLNRYSSLHYTRFYNMDRRTVFLNGEAFFEVVSNDSIPFYVVCGPISTMVTGTSFNVKLAKGNKVEVSVVTGTVEVENSMHPGQKIILHQQEKLVFSEAAASFSKEKSNKKDLKWRERKTFKKRIQSLIQKFRKKA